MEGFLIKSIDVLIGTPKAVMLTTIANASLFNPSLAANCSFALSVIAVIIADITLPNVKAFIETDRQKTPLNERIIALHGIDGSMSNQVYYGAIDTFCTNGQITGEYDKVRRKNTSRFNIDVFIDELQNAKQDFYAQSKRLQQWANITLDGVNVDDIIKSIVKSDRKAAKMNAL